MKLKFEKISEKKFQDFYDNYKEEKTFLQTIKFSQFRKKIGESIFLYGIFEKDLLIGIALIQKIKTRIKTFLHCPHGALIKKENTETWNYFLKKYKTLGKKENCDFVRISPLLSPEKKELFKKQKFIKAPIHLVNPEKTWVLNLEISEDEILKKMKKSTRYEIRRQKKCEIEVDIGNTKKEFDIFWNLHLETVKRQGFVPFPKKTTILQLETWKDNCLIFNGKSNSKFYSSAIILFDKKSAYYHQGASIYSKKPVSHAVLWQAILESKKRGCSEFNFWGICDSSQKKHPWFGLSKFKRGFGGEERNFLHCQDFPLTSKYWLNFVVEKYRKWKKNY